MDADFYTQKQDYVRWQWSE